MTQKQKNIKKWVKALRSGKYQQTKSRLQDEKGYCCLGVACDIFIPRNKQQLKNNCLIGITPIYQKAPKWLRNINHEWLFRYGSSLANMNDGEDMSFDEIADCLEIVYIHKL